MARRLSRETSVSLFETFVIASGTSTKILDAAQFVLQTLMLERIVKVRTILEPCMAAAAVAVCATEDAAQLYQRRFAFAVAGIASRKTALLKAPRGKGTCASGLTARLFRA